MLLARRTRALQRYLPAALRGDHHGVHQARVATRRLREAVPVLTTGLKGGKAAGARRKIRRLTRALGSVRELDVTMHILDELARRPEVPRNALEDVRTHVVAERDARREVMLERLERVDSDKLSRRLQAVATTLSRCDANAWRVALASRLVKRAGRLTAAIREAGHIYAADRLHQVRIAAKKLRYAMELAADGRVPGAGRLVAELKRAQDTLGRLHDLQVLQHHVAAVASAPPSRRGGHDGGLGVIEQALEAECRHLHGKYLASSQSLLDAAERCRTQVSVQLARSTVRRGRSLKMALPVSRRKPAARRA
jgi:CHAD domain-containing protein